MIRPVARIGVLLPEGNITCEVEFPQLGQSEASFHFQRLHRDGAALSAESLLTLHRGVDAALAALRDTSPRAYVFACTSGTFLAGHDRHDDAAARIRAATGCPAITTASALLQACSALTVRRLHMLAPYPDAITRQEAEFLAFHGVDASHYDTLECRDGNAIRGLDESTVYQRLMARADDARRADAVFLSCTNMPTLGLIEALEADLGVPVFSSNTATAWAGLRLAGVAGDTPAIGVLGRQALPERAHFSTTFDTRNHDGRHP